MDHRRCNWTVLFAVVSLLFTAAGCGSSGTTPSGLALSALSLAFSSTTTQEFTVSEPGYNGTFSASSSDAKVVTVSQVGVSTSKATFTVAPVGGGSATITVYDDLGHTASVSANVTGITFTPQLHR
jgi:hypothetical protein